MTQPKILIVEDERIVAKEIARLLTDHGYQVTGLASSARTSMESIADSRPDLVLMDIKIEGEQDGIETAKAIHDRYDLPVVYITSYADTATIERVKHTAPYGFITKPVTHRALTAAIDLALHRHQADRKVRESEQRYRMMFERHAAVKLLIDPESGRILDANPAALDYYGYDLAKMKQLKIADINIMDQKLVQEEMERARRQQKGFFEFRHRLASGEIRDVDVYSCPIEYEGRPALFSIIHDATERKRAEQAVQDSEEKFRLAFEYAPDAILWADAESGELLNCNRAGERLLGRSRTDIVGRNQTELHPPEEADLYRKAFTEYVPHGSHDAEGEVQRADGRRIPVRLTGEVAVIAGRRIVQGVIRDISQRKAAENALKKAVEKYRNLFDNAILGIFQSTPTGTYREINNAFAHIFGYESADEMMACVADIGSQLYVNREDRSKIKELLEKDGVVQGFEVQILRRDGSYGWISINAEAREDAEGVYYEGTIEDISEKWEARQRLQESKERFRAVFDNACVGIDILDRDGRFVEVNTALATMLGYNVDELQQLSLREITHPDDREESGKFLTLLIAGAMQSYRLEKRYIARDGSIVRGDLSASLLRDEGGKILGILGVIADITERKREEWERWKAEEALRRNEERLRLAQEAAKAGTWEWDLKTNENVWYDEIWPLYELEPKSVEPSYEAWRQTIHPDDREEVERTVREAAANLTELNAEWRTNHPEGIERWLKSRGRPIFDEHGQAIRYVGIVMDITDRRKVEEAVKQSETKYRRLFDLSPMGILSCDRHGRIMEVNPKLLQILGSPSQEAARAINVLEFPPLRDAGFAEAFEKCMATGDSLSFEAPYVSAWGQEAFLRVVVNPIFDGEEVHGCQAVVEDVSEAKAVEADLRLKALVLDQIQDFVTITDLSGTITYVNRAAINSHQRTPRELLGSSTAAFGEPPESRGIQKEIREKTLRDGSWEGEVVNYRKDGSAIVIWLRTIVVRDDTGKPTCLCGFGADITERKKLQALSLQAEKYKAVADLSAGVAHNFNNLLQIVIGNTELALMDIRSGEFESLEGKLTEIMNTSRFGAETVRRLNRFVRQAEPGEKEEIHVFDLSEAVRTVVTMSKPLWSDEPKKKGLSVNLDCRLKHGCTIRGRQSEFFEVMVNLVKNAVEALPEGGDIEIDTVREHDKVVLRVHDTGIGIPASNVNRLFTPFFKTSVEAGRGLGLSTCRTLVDAHGGTILVDSTEGAGATFTIRLPFAPPEPDTPKPSEPARSLRPLHILAIDDMEATLTLLKSGLGKMGHAVITALSGEHGLALLEDNPVDVVICDLGMPEMNGWQVGEAIKRRCSEEGVNKPVFIMLTGWGGQSGEKQKIAASGVDAVLEKPVDIAKLSAVIQDVMERE